VKKEIVFAARFNTQEFNSQLKEMQQRIVAATNAMGGTLNSGAMADRMKSLGISAPGAPSGQERDQAFKRSAKELEGIMRDQWKQARELNKELDERLKKAKELRKEEEALLKAGKDASEVSRKRGEIEADIRKKEADHSLRMQAVKEASETREKLNDYKPSGWGRIKNAFTGAYNNSSGSGMSQFASGVGGAGSAAYRMAGGGFGLGMAGLGLVASGIQMADPIARSMAAQDRVMAGAQGSAVQGMSGPLRDVYGGNLRSSMFFGSERATAVQRAMKETSTNRNWDQVSPYAALGGKMAGGALAGAALGTGVGAVGGVIAGAGLFSVPTAIAGAAAGKATGALLGGGMGLAKGVYDIYSDDQQRDTVLSQFGSEDARKRIESRYSSDLAARMNENLESEKARSPIKVLAEQQYSAGMESNLNFQRSMGMNNNQFYGQDGFLDKGMQSGFTRSQMMGSSSDIISSGGSTRAATDSARFSNQLQRADITNASSLVGRLSGNMGSAAMTEQATIRVLSEGVKVGLDKSEFREEQRKFADLTANFVVSSGANSQAGVARASQEFSSYFGETPTMGAMNQSGAAQSFLEGATAQTGNPRGAIFAAKVMSDPTLSKLDSRQKASLSQLSLSEINEDNPMIIDMAEKAGMGNDVKGFVTIAKNVKLDSVTMTQSSEDALNKLKGMSDEEVKNNKGAVGNLMNKMFAEDSSLKGLAKLPKAQEQLARRLRKGEISPEDITPEMVQAESLAMKGTNSTGTGRMEDTDMAAIANQQKIVNDQFREMAPALEEAAKAAMTLTAQALDMSLVLNKAIADGKQITPEMVKQQIDFWGTAGKTSTKPGATKAK